MQRISRICVSVLTKTLLFITRERYKNELNGEIAFYRGTGELFEKTIQLVRDVWTEKAVFCTIGWYTKH